MITFSSDILKEQIAEAIKTLNYLKGDIEEIEFNELFSDEGSDYDLTITEESTVCIYIGECDYPFLSVKQFIELALVQKESTINADQSYAKNRNEVYFLLDSFEYNTSELLYNTFNRKPHSYSHNQRPTSVLKKSVEVNGKTYTCSLFNGFCIFHSLVEKSGNFDEECPSYSPYDYFVKISCNQELNMGEADALAHAYIFELQSSFNLVLPFSTGRIAPFAPDRSDESLLGMESKLFPLIYGIGASELLSLYNTAKSTIDLDFKILGFTKVIEYIAPTISQKALLENVTMKLTSLSIFAPTAKFIAELGGVYEKHRYTSNKDSELIKLSILTAVSLDEIWEKVPDFIKGKQINLPDEQNQVAFLEKISECVYNTRNEIAHAKANYDKKGNECPQKHKAEFCEMLDLVAVRCIRWFAIQPEDKRVVLN